MQYPRDKEEPPSRSSSRNNEGFKDNDPLNLSLNMQYPKAKEEPPSTSDSRNNEGFQDNDPHNIPLNMQYPVSIEEPPSTSGSRNNEALQDNDPLDLSFLEPITPDFDFSDVEDAPYCVAGGVCSSLPPFGSLYLQQEDQEPVFGLFDGFFSQESSSITALDDYGAVESPTLQPSAPASSSTERPFHPLNALDSLGTLQTTSSACIPTKRTRSGCEDEMDTETPSSKMPRGEKDASANKCRHCGLQNTSQWRSGPEGPQTLCNACGIRFKKGGLLPEYRPAASPTFDLAQHSNWNRKVNKIRREKGYSDPDKSKPSSDKL